MAAFFDFYHWFILLGVPFLAWRVAADKIAPKAEKQARAGNLFVEAGDVVASEVWSETRVTSHVGSTGGGYVHPVYGGYVPGPDIKVSSSIETNQRFFVRLANGLEKKFSITGDDAFPVREGHRIWLVSDAKNYLALQNMSTGHTYFFEWSMRKYVKMLQVGAGDIALWLVVAIISCAMATDARPSAEPALLIIEAGTGFLVAFWIRITVVRSRATRALKEVIIEKFKSAPTH